MIKVLLLTLTIILVIVFLVQKLVTEPFIRETFIRETFNNSIDGPTSTVAPSTIAAPSTTAAPIIFVAPSNVKIEDVTDTSFKITFNPPANEETHPKPIQYMVLITRIDSENKPDGAVRLIFSNEVDGGTNTELQGEVDTTVEFNSDCSPCNYTFRNLEKNIRYKVGVMAVYEGGNSEIAYATPTIVTPGVDNIVPTTTASPLPEEEELVEDITPKEDMLATADGSYVRVKQELGGYPDNLFLKLKTGSNDLSELVKRQLALGIVNANVHTKGL